VRLSGTGQRGAWTRPTVFAAALLNSQPMGFYAPAQIVGDARTHGVEVRPLDFDASDWGCTLEPELRSADEHALRLGLRLASGLSEEEGRLLVKVRHSGNGSPY
jgi:error-prone DNA polymerase